MEANLENNTLNKRQVTNYQEWFISALKSTKVLDNGSVDERNLLQNCVACQNEVKRLLEKNENQWIIKYEEFCLNSTIILFLSCPSVKSVSKITLSKDLLSLIKSLPSISEASAFLVLQRLKNYLCLRGILPWLPVPTLFSLVSNFFTAAKLVTPISLAISYEFLIGLSNSIMYNNECDNACEIINTFDTFLEFFVSMEHNFDGDHNIKLEAYFFLYVFKILLTYIKLLVTQTSEDLTASYLGLQLKNLYKESPKVYPQSLEEIFDDFVKKLITILCRISPLITSHVWIEWHSIRLPPLELQESQLHISLIKMDSDEILVKKSVQLEISQTAFKINKYLVNEEHTRDILKTQDFPEFFEFVKSIAVDPDHDPDYDFSNEKLIESINKNEIKRKKFINILFTRENIFESSECLGCAKAYGLFLKKECIINLLLKVIYTLKNDNLILEEWVQVILDLAKKVPAEDLSSIIRNELNNGKDDILKTKSFDQDLTFVFNQLSESQDNEYNRLFAWLCLQDGKVVIKRFVEHVISLSGMASVAASALKTVYFICKTEEDKDISILTSCLVNCWNENMPEQEQKEFLSLILKLLGKKDMEACDHEKPFEELEILPIKILEVMDYFILPKLNTEIQKGPCIPASVEILKAIINLYPNEIVGASPKFTSLLISLTFLYNNCNYLRNPDYSITLTLRSSLQFIIIKMIKQINQNKEDFNKVLAYVEHVVSSKVLHPRCLLLLSLVIDFVVPDSLSVSDDIFRHIFLGSADSIFIQQIPKSLPDATRMQWVWSLFTQLPHCSSEEWRHAVKLTHVYLNQSVGYSIMVIPTLKLLQEVLFLICTMANSSGLDDTEVPVGLQESSLSVDCCFKMFSLAATNFISERIREESSEQQFYSLVNIFIWWCKSFEGFTCNPELPSIFLNSLSNLIQDLFNSELLIVTESSDLVNLENKNFLKKTGIEVHSLKDSVAETNEKVLLKQKPKSIYEVDGSRPNSQKSTSEFLSKVQFMEKIEQMVKSFIVYVPVNKVGATVAGKLKALYERHDLCVSSFVDK